MHLAVRPSPTPSVGSPMKRGSWVPIRTLSAPHRAQIEEHLRSLVPIDRYLRFGHIATDAQIANYVALLDFDRDEVFGIFNRRLQLIAMAHLANISVPGENLDRAVAEFGVSVITPARGRGYGARLFDHATLHARNRGVSTLVIHALSENTPMLAIARRAGAIVHREGPEAQASLKLPPQTVATRVGELVERQAAELDYQWKASSTRLGPSWTFGQR